MSLWCAANTFSLQIDWLIKLMSIHSERMCRSVSFRMHSNVTLQWPEHEFVLHFIYMDVAATRMQRNHLQLQKICKLPEKQPNERVMKYAAISMVPHTHTLEEMESTGQGEMGKLNGCMCVMNGIHRREENAEQLSFFPLTISLFVALPSRLFQSSKLWRLADEFHRMACRCNQFEKA